MSEPVNTGGPAFPRDSKWALDGSIVQQGGVGMSLRAYYAGQALPAVMREMWGDAGGIDDIAAASVQIADALIAELNRKPTT